MAENIENNSQCWARNRAEEDYEVIMGRITEVFGQDFDFENTPKFKKRVVGNK